MGWFEEQFNSLRKKMNWAFRDLESEEAIFEQPPVSIRESGEKVIVKFKLPGFLRKEIKLKVSSDNLEVRAEKVQVVRIDKGKVRKASQSYKKYYRKIPLSVPVDHNKAQVQYQGDILEVALPKIKRKIKFFLK